MGEGEVKESNTSKSSFSFDNLIASIQQLHELLDLNVIRLTGGEPLLYKQLVPLVKAISTIGIPEIKLTTNGFLLERLAKPLKEAGMNSVNISLDAVDEDVFFLMSRRNNVQRILDGIDAAIEAGLEVKLNTVLMKGINDQQIIPLAEFAFKRRIAIRFLEVMAMGHLYADAHKYLVTKDDVLHTMTQRYDFVPLLRKEGATANYWRTNEGHEFGVIANESAPFCHDCNRLRLDSDGNLYGCISDERPVSIRNIEGKEEWYEKLAEALNQKQVLKFSGSPLSMMHIGG
jgi:cyclic pyranopterin phosphate synthase